MKPLQQVDRTCVRWGKRRLIYYGGCDYFRLASDPRVRKALCAGLADYGLNVAASRVTTGHHLLYDRLERELTRFFGAPAAVLVPNGYSTNLAVTQALKGDYGAVLLDEQAHPSLRDAVRFLDCPVISFKHRNVQDLVRQVAIHKGKGRLLVATDGMFSLTGALAPLRAYLDALPESALLLVDDAHAAGVHGKTGKGTVELEHLSRARVVQTVTLSKAFGVYGGAILGSRRLRERIVQLSGPFIGSTPLPLPLAAAALEAVKILSRQPSLRSRLFRNTEDLAQSLRGAGMNVAEPRNPIFAFRPISTAGAGRVRRRLLEAGIYPPLIRYGSRGTEAVFRFALSSEHSREQLERLGEALIRSRDLLVRLH